ncbi:hypothetical protein MC885_001250, partial [Smutsia gigantea]
MVLPAPRGDYPGSGVRGLRRWEGPGAGRGGAFRGAGRLGALVAQSSRSGETRGGRAGRSARLPAGSKGNPFLHGNWASPTRPHHVGTSRGEQVKLPPAPRKQDPGLRIPESHFCIPPFRPGQLLPSAPGPPTVSQGLLTAVPLGISAATGRGGPRSDPSRAGAGDPAPRDPPFVMGLHAKLKNPVESKSKMTRQVIELLRTENKVFAEGEKVAEKRTATRSKIGRKDKPRSSRLSSHVHLLRHGPLLSFTVPGAAQEKPGNRMHLVLDPKFPVLTLAT